MAPRCDAITAILPPMMSSRAGGSEWNQGKCGNIESGALHNGTNCQRGKWKIIDMPVALVLAVSLKS
jgi:hypothetical protein